MRKIFFWLHLAAGVIAGLVILIMSVTGVLLTYEKQMVSWFDQRSLPAVQSHTRLALEDLIRQAQEQSQATPSSIAIPSDPARPLQLSFGRNVVYQDGSTGKILGSGDSGVRQFFRTVTDWHRWLAASGESRATGRAITGASNLAFLFIVLSGAYLWIPRVWTKASVRAIAWFRGDLSGKARDFNWHNTIGIWSLIPLVLIVASGCVISYPWASNLVYTLTGTQAPAGPGNNAPQANAGTKKGKGSGNGEQRPEGNAARAPRGGPGAVASLPADMNVTGLNAVWDQATAQGAGWKLLTLRLSNSDRNPVMVTMDHGYAGQPQKRLTMSFDQKTGQLKNTEKFEDLNAGRRLRSWLRFVHTGEFYGLTGQTIAGIASLGAVVLTYTGIALSLRRFTAWRSRRSRSQKEEMMEVQKVS